MGVDDRYVGGWGVTWNLLYFYILGGVNCVIVVLAWVGRARRVAANNF